MTIDKAIGLNSGPRDEMEQNWVECRALRAGTRGMRAARTLLTPKTARELKPTAENANDALYNARLATSCLHNVFMETVTEISSAPFGKPPTITGQLPEFLGRIVDDADRRGSSLSVFAAQIYQDGVERGLGMFLVDSVPTVIDEPVIDPKTKRQEIGADGKPRTTRTTLRRDQAEAADARPYFARIDPDCFVGADFEDRLGQEVCVGLRVREWAYVRDGDKDRLVERIRAYDTVNVSLWQRIYTKTGMAVIGAANTLDSDPAGFELIQGPRPHGFPGNKIPLIVFYTDRLGPAHARPPLLDLAHLNVKHWNQQSVLDSTLRYCLAPTLFASGVDTADTEKPPATGEGSRLFTTSTDAELRYVEIAGTSLEVARAEIAKTEERMRGKRDEALRKGIATATGEMRADLAENAEAQKWIEAMEWAIYNGFKAAERYDIGEKLPQDFDVALQRQSLILQAMSPQHTTALQFDVREGVITHDTYRRERARAGAYGPEFDPDAEAAALEAEKESAQEAQILMMKRTIEDERAAAAAGKPPAGDPDGEKAKDEEKAA